MSLCRIPMSNIRARWAYILPAAQRRVMKMPANLWSLGHFAPHFCKAKPKQTNNNKHMPRVSTYLNFPRSTEDAFWFQGMRLTNPTYHFAAKFAEVGG